MHALSSPFGLPCEDAVGTHAVQHARCVQPDAVVACSGSVAALPRLAKREGGGKEIMEGAHGLVVAFVRPVVVDAHKERMPCTHGLKKSAGALGRPTPTQFASQKLEYLVRCSRPMHVSFWPLTQAAMATGVAVRCAHM